MPVSTMTEQVKFETKLPLGKAFNDERLWTFELFVTGHYYPETQRIIIDVALCFDNEAMPAGFLEALRAQANGSVTGVVFPARDSGCAALQYTRTAGSFTGQIASILRDLCAEHGLSWENA
jgi:hypothetical protein